MKRVRLRGAPECTEKFLPLCECVKLCVISVYDGISSNTLQAWCNLQTFSPLRRLSPGQDGQDDFYTIKSYAYYIYVGHKSSRE